MKVAYDLRYATDHFAGIGTHAFALLESLLALDDDSRYAVLWNPALANTRFDVAPIRRHARVTWVEKPIPAIHPAGLLPLGAWLRAERPDVYVSPFYLRPVASGVPEALTIHDVHPLRLSEDLSPLRLALYRASLRWAAGARAILTSSAFSRDEIVTLTSIRPERVHAILLGTYDAGVAAAATPPAGLPARPYALVVGDSRPRKNLEVVARAWAALGEAPPLALVSVGATTDRHPSLATLARRHGARDVHALGWQSPADLAAVLERAQLLLFPSRYEGFGFPIVEAFAAGVPVIASDTPVFREVAGDAALHVDPDRPAAWAQAVLSLATSAPARDALRERGRRRAAELSYRRTAESTRAVLRAIAKR